MKLHAQKRLHTTNLAKIRDWWFISKLVLLCALLIHEIFVPFHEFYLVTNKQIAYQSTAVSEYKDIKGADHFRSRKFASQVTLFVRRYSTEEIRHRNVTNAHG
jgi:hypothetical protein